jgi:predicted membrane-bound spermidine synthase
MPNVNRSKSSASLGWFFVFFLISGFCSILYELVWLRLAMAQFGVTSALVSIVISMFMAGLGLGCWLAGRWVRGYDEGKRMSALRLYALTELLIGSSALLVPRELAWGRALLVHFSLVSSLSYYVVSGVWIALTLVPWCACMGATIPVAMLAIRNRFPEQSQRSFSYLYLANVLGAVAGSMVPLFLIEIYGFRGTLRAGAFLNLLLAIAAVALSFRLPICREALEGQRETGRALPSAEGNGRLLVLLFATGCTSMGIEVVWIRQFTPYIGTVVYAFATILAVYLAFTFVGSRIYRLCTPGFDRQGGLLWALLGATAMISLVSASPAIHLSHGVRLLWGVAPFSAMLGFVTPMLVDHWSGGDPDKAGRGYAVNVLGCIAGPLLAGFVLLPLMSERWTLLVFAFPWLLLAAFWRGGRVESGRTLRQPVAAYAVVAIALIFPFAGEGFEEQFADKVVLRDSTATVIATGAGMRKRLLVNGYGVTALTPVTKMMAHLPLAMLDHPPKNVLVICFGMGTTYRSMLSWKIPATAVELVPSVPRLFWFYHPDAAELLSSPLSHVVIDDGRRYLERTREQYDVIAIDPPPPVEAAGSSLLYTKEFYATIKQRLAPGGILQQWLPEGDPVTQASVARALVESFPYIRVFRSVEHWGFHFSASNDPLPNRSAIELVERMPADAVNDMMEWGPQATPERQFAVVLDSELPITQLTSLAPAAPAMQDDRPLNEYYVLRRRLGARWQSLLGDERMPAPAQR